MKGMENLVIEKKTSKYKSHELDVFLTEARGFHMNSITIRGKIEVPRETMIDFNPEC